MLTHLSEIVIELPLMLRSSILQIQVQPLSAEKNHTIWAILLTIAAINILFFAITSISEAIERRKSQIQNEYDESEAEYILLYGSENGATTHLANMILKQLLTHGQKAYLAELNSFDLQSYPHIKQLIIFASTFGLGDATTNANKFLGKLEETDYAGTLPYTIVGFGSTNYPDFCGYAKRIVELMTTKPWAQPLLPLHTVNDKSLADFTDWVRDWSDTIHLPLITSPDYYADQSHRKLYSFKVVAKSEKNVEDHNFTITLEPSEDISFHSGDLFAIYPENNEKERLYSIGKIGNVIQLVVKHHEQGLGSTYLHNLKIGDTIQAAIQYNHLFHLHKNQTSTVFVSNGTGIAPFLGMLHENSSHVPITVYAGFRKREPLQLTLDAQLSQLQNEKKLQDFTIAYSREENSEDKYVYELVETNITFIKNLLDNGGIVMICGAIAMHNEVTAKLKRYCPDYDNYLTKNQIRSDCY